MPVRTTPVVAAGLVALTLVGVGTIFGESLAALITPPPATDTASAQSAPGPASSAAPAKVQKKDEPLAKPARDGSS